MLFMGEYNHSIDAKGRITVPNKFRGKLGDRFVVTKGLERCLWVFPSSEWDSFSERLASTPVTNKTARKVSRFFLSGAVEVETDKMGRILLPQVLRDYAELIRDAVLVGNGKRVEIWNKDTWAEASTFEDVEELAEQLGEIGFGI